MRKTLAFWPGFFYCTKVLKYKLVNIQCESRIEFNYSG